MSLSPHSCGKGAGREREARALKNVDLLLVLRAEIQKSNLFLLLVFLKGQIIGCFSHGDLLLFLDGPEPDGSIIAAGHKLVGVIRNQGEPPHLIHKLLERSVVPLHQNSLLELVLLLFRVLLLARAFWRFELEVGERDLRRRTLDLVYF